MTKSKLNISKIEEHKVLTSVEPKVGDRILFTRNMQTMMYSDDSINGKVGVITNIEEDMYGRADHQLFFIKFDGEKYSGGYGRGNFSVLA